MGKSLFMKCPRCSGTMLHDKFYGPNDQFWGWKCLICGEIIDPVILENRHLMSSGQGVSLPRPGIQMAKMHT